MFSGNVISDPTSRRLIAVLFLFLTSPLAWSQAYEKVFADHVLRSSVVSSESVAAASAAAHGIARGPDVAILNVTVLKKGSQQTETVPAKVEALATSLAGIRSTIEMVETRTNDRVSYTGTFKFVPREVLDFTIRAQPSGSSEQLEMSYRDRVWTERKPP